jgi:uncharacterized surface anchored protein
MRRLTFLAIFALVASFILVPAALAQEEEIPEIIEEQAEDPQEPVEENVAEGQQEAAFEEQIEAQQGMDLTPEQEAALEPQAELEGVEPEAAAAQPKAEPKAAPKEEPKEEPKMMEEKGKEKEKMKEMPKTGGPGIGMLLPVGVLLLGSSIVAFAVVRRRG